MQELWLPSEIIFKILHTFEGHVPTQ